MDIPGSYWWLINMYKPPGAVNAMSKTFNLWLNLSDRLLRSVHFLFVVTTYQGIYNSCVSTWSWVLWSFATMPILLWDDWLWTSHSSPINHWRKQNVGWNIPMWIMVNQREIMGNAMLCHGFSLDQQAVRSLKPPSSGLPNFTARMPKS